MKSQTSYSENRHAKTITKSISECLLKIIWWLFILFPVTIGNLYSQSEIVLLKNIFRDGHYIKVEKRQLSAGKIGNNELIGMWNIEWINSEYFRLRKVGTNQYLHTETGALTCSPVPSNYGTSWWRRIEVPGTNFFRIENSFRKNQFLNLEGPLAASNVPKNYATSWWEFEYKDYETCQAGTVFLKNKFRDGHFIKVENDQLSAGKMIDPISGMWNIEWINSEYFRLRKIGTNQYLHTETGALTCSPVPSNYGTSWWRRIEVPGTNFFRIENSFRENQFLNLEGPLAASNVPKNYATSWWEFIDKTMSLNTSTWMGKIRDDVSLAALSIPGTHDSGADYGCPSFAYSAYAKCQDWSIAQQLNSGIRYLDIRCRRIGNVLSIHHGKCYQQKNFGDIVQACKEFLRKNPSETILMRIKDEGDSDSQKSFEELFKSYYNNNENLWYTSSSIPTMGKARGKIVIYDNGPIRMGIQSKVDIQDQYYFTDVKNKWSPVYEHLNKAKNNRSNENIFINHFSATGLSSGFADLAEGLFNGPPTPKDFADHIIPKAQGYFDSNNSGRFGVIAMDFPTHNIILQIIRTNTCKFTK